MTRKSRREEASGAPDDQGPVIAFLSDPASYPASPANVEIVETHGAMVFLAGADVYKIKRAVRFDYMDFSTLERRRAVCDREVQINQPHAPGIYLGVVPITRAPDSDHGLAIGGHGEPVEWAVHMRRFPDRSLLADIATDGKLLPALAMSLARKIADYHTASTVHREQSASTHIARTIEQVDIELDGTEFGRRLPGRQAFSEAAWSALNACRAVLDQRGKDGFVRRAHGDLHMRNVVVINEHPVLFDAIEFNEAIATVDVLYDLAFLLMDLEVEGYRAPANLLMNRYLYHADAESNLDTLCALPLFMAMRAAIRTFVHAQRSAQCQPGESAGGQAAAETYFSAARRYLTHRSPVLVAVGGLSGTGKSTLAAALAPDAGRAPGALHIRSDLERKSMLGVAETTRLPPGSYTRESAAKVYERIYAKASRALAAGQAVIADAVFLQPGERAAIEQVAAALNVPFVGLWLEAPGETASDRVARRRGDASDATADVVAMQLRNNPGVIHWAIVDAGSNAETTLMRARQVVKF